MAAVKPGVPINQVDLAARQVIESKTLSKFESSFLDRIGKQT